MHIVSSHVGWSGGRTLVLGGGDGRLVLVSGHFRGSIK